MMMVTINAVIAFCTHQYVSYAVFMSARAYQAAGGTADESHTRAVAALQSYLPGIPDDSGEGLSIPLTMPGMAKPIATIEGVNVRSPQLYDYGPAGEIANVEIYVDFSVPFVDLPLGPEMRARFGKIPLRASSFFGREASQQECQAFFKRFLESFKISGEVAGAYENFSSEFFGNMEDNGC